MQRAQPERRNNVPHGEDEAGVVCPATVRRAGAPVFAGDDAEPILGPGKGGDDLGVGDGQPVTLRLELNQAKLFGIEFE